MRIEVDNGNASMEYIGNDFRIIIPSKKKWFTIIFMIIWLGGWAMGEFFALSAALTGEIGEGVVFLVFWLAGWTLGGGFALFIVLWMLFGKEVIYSDRALLIIEKKLLWFKISKEYDINSIKNMRIKEENRSFFSRKRGLDYFGFTGGLLFFDYGMKTIQFGVNIDIPEAKYLLDSIFNSGVMSIYTQIRE